MRILLLGEYSNVHATLAEGLRALGHDVTVASNGDFWKDYPRDIDLARREGKMGGLALMAKVYACLPKWRGFDVVQLINPMFLELKAERIFPIYRYLRRHNKMMVLCAMGMDWYWVHECTYHKPLRYSDFNIGDKVRTDEPALKEQRDWLGTAKERLNRYIAADCDQIITGLYEYQICYEPYFKDKTHFIPLPIKMPCHHSRRFSVGHSPSHPSPLTSHPSPLRLFIGISKGRSAYKGTDIMLRAAEDMQRRYPDRLQIVKAEGVPFNQYQQMLNGSDALMDQLYAYTPAMNALLAMSRGIICIGGGEPENYEILGENELRPIINVQPTYDSVCHELEQLILHPEHIPLLKQQSIDYVDRHHDHVKVARQYEEAYRRKI
ncbi:MAG: glycosyltransferase family 1 protein [Prevotella sp.]|nr:glycosyltransferase family 1 protein [Prevotella sp.]